MITRLYRYFRDFQEYKTEYLRERLSIVGVSTYAGHDLDCGLDTYHLTHCTFPIFSVQNRTDPDYNIYVNVNYKAIPYTYFSYTISANSTSIMSSLLSASSAYSRASSSYQHAPSSMCQTKSPSPGFRMYSPVFGDPMAPILPASSFGPDPFLTPPAIERGGRTFGYASASQNWRNSVNEARGNMITSASQGGVFMSSSQSSSAQEVGNYQAQLDSVLPQPRVHLKAPQLHFDTPSGVTGLASHPVEEQSFASAGMAKSGSNVTGFASHPGQKRNFGSALKSGSNVTGFASHPGQKRNFGSAFTADSDAVCQSQDLRKKSRPRPVLTSQQSVQREPVVRKTAGLFTDPDQARRQRSLQMEMDIIEDIDNHTPHFGTPNPRVLLGKRTYGYGTTPGTSSSDAHDSMSSSQRPRPSSSKSPITVDDEVSSICSRQQEPNCDSWKSQSPFLTPAEELGMSVTPDQGSPFTKSHRDWIMDGFPSSQPREMLDGILLNAFPQCWVRPVGCPVSNPHEVTMATFRWCDLLLDATSDDTVRLAFNMPTFTMGNGQSKVWTMRSVEWTVPLDATWNDVALVISDSTPIDMSKVTFQGRHGRSGLIPIWKRATTVREFGPWDHQTFDVIVGEIGGSDRDQDNEAVEMELREDGTTGALDSTNAEAVHPLFSEAWYEAVAEAKQQEDDVEHAMWRDDSHQSDVEEAASENDSKVPHGNVSSLRAMGEEIGTSQASSSVAVVASGVPEISKGDRVSVDATVFDGDEPGSYSNDYPGRHYGVVTSFKSKNVVRVRWESNKMVELCRLSDLLLDVNYGRPAPRAIAVLKHSHYSQSTASPVAKANSDDANVDGSDGYDSDASELSDSSRVLRAIGVHDAHDGELEESSRNAEDRAAADCAATSSAFVASLQAIGILDAQGAVSPQYQGIMTRHAVQKMEGEVRRHQAPTPQGATPLSAPTPSRNHHWPAEPPAVPTPQGWSVPSWGPPTTGLSADPVSSSVEVPVTVTVMGRNGPTPVQAPTQVVQEERQASPAYQRQVPQRGVSRRRQSRPADDQYARGYGQARDRSARSSPGAAGGRSPEGSSSQDSSPGGLRGGDRTPRDARWCGAEPSFHDQRRFENEGPEPPSFYSQYPQTNSSKSKLRSSICCRNSRLPTRAGRHGTGHANDILASMTSTNR